MSTPKKQQQPVTLHMLLRTILITMAVTAVVTVVAIPFGMQYHKRVTATRILTNAKSALLAVHSIALDCYGQNKPFSDPTAPYGIDEEARKRVIYLADCQGELHLLQWNPKELRADQLLYTEEEYAVYYLRDAEGVHWNVFEASPIISH